jgi:hypothetical protein
MSTPFVACPLAKGVVMSRQYRHFTEQEDKVVVAPNLTLSQIAAQLGRTFTSVKARRQKLLGKPADTNPDGLLPCPFCPDGGDPVVEQAGTTGIFWGGCRKCHTQGPPRMVRAQAIVAWNTRLPAGEGGGDGNA